MSDRRIWQDAVAEIENKWAVRERRENRINAAVERYAARFAAKEALMKALGVGLGSFAFREVEVNRADSGDPTLALHGKAAAIAAERGAANWHVSLTHSDVVAIAFVAIE
jgi:holo-[acyl-carrier protein] synthase